MSQPLNTAEALALLDGDTRLYRMVAEMFMNESSAAWQQFEEQWARGDHVAATRAIHTLKSMAASVGAELLREHAQTLELAARSGDKGSVEAGLAAAGQELIVAQELIVRFLQSLSEGSAQPGSAQSVSTQGGTVRVG